MIIKNKTEFLNRYVEGAVDQQYYTQLFSLLEELDVPLTEYYGFALIKLFYEYTIVFVNEEKIGGGNEFMGTVGEICEAIALAYADINQEPAWWKLQYTSRQGSESIEKALNSVLDQLSKKPFVQYVEKTL